MTGKAGTIIELERLRDRVSVFRDRSHAGQVLAEMLEEHKERVDIVLAIPAGGVPVAVVIARFLGVPVDVAVVSKITLPWNTEAGYGAVAFDGTMRLNNALVDRLTLTQLEIDQGIKATTEKVQRRAALFRGNRPEPSLSERSVLLVDDGLASGFTMRVAIEAVRNSGAERILVGVPTGHAASVRDVAGEVDRLYCANIRGGWSYAVAGAYERWYDVSEEEALDLLEQGASHTS